MNITKPSQRAHYDKKSQQPQPRSGLVHVPGSVTDVARFARLHVDEEVAVEGMVRSGQYRGRLFGVELPIEARRVAGVLLHAAQGGRVVARLEVAVPEKTWWSKVYERANGKVTEGEW